MHKPVRFDGRVAVVTGAGRGLGRAHALLLASRGAVVVVNDIGFALVDGGAASSGPADDVAQEIVAGGGHAVANSDDVSSAAGANRLIEQTLEAFGKLDIVVNNAGTAQPISFIDMTETHFDFMLKNHLYGTFHVTRAAWPHMIAAGYGHVVMTTSGVGMFGLAGNAHYCAAKGGIYGLVRGLALEGAPLGIQVNGFWPSAYTRMVGNDPNLKERMQRSMPADWASSVAIWLAHEHCTLNGEVLHGGSGRASRVLVAETPGYVRRGLTLEDVAQHEDQVLREDGYFAFKSTMESSQTQTALVEAAIADSGSTGTGVKAR